VQRRSTKQVLKNEKQLKVNLIKAAIALKKLLLKQKNANVNTTISGTKYNAVYYRIVSLNKTNTATCKQHYSKELMRHTTAKMAKTTET